ncbi:MAG: hypothetical protein K8F62_07355 [Pseudorhodoplanes sp.]|nr:hypothetical protein [Pseudorhodoplanes sp.]
MQERPVRRAPLLIRQPGMPEIDPDEISPQYAEIRPSELVKRAIQALFTVMGRKDRVKPRTLG